MTSIQSHIGFERCYLIRVISDPMKGSLISLVRSEWSAIQHTDQLRPDRLRGTLKGVKASKKCQLKPKTDTINSILATYWLFRIFKIIFSAELPSTDCYLIIWSWNENLKMGGGAICLSLLFEHLHCSTVKALWLPHQSLCGPCCQSIRFADILDIKDSYFLVFVAFSQS